MDAPNDIDVAFAQPRSPDGTQALGRRNGRLLLVGVAAYSVFIVVLMFLRGIDMTPDVLAVALGLLAVMLGRGRLFIRDWVPFIALFLAYELVRGLAGSLAFPVHIGSMVSTDRLVALGRVPTAALQAALRPASGVDLVAELATVVYMLHFVLPLVTGFILWLWRRPAYYDFVAALILLSLAAFATYVVMPTAPPWYAAQAGALNNSTGTPILAYLKPNAFESLANAFGFKASYLYTYAFYDINPDNVAAWPSLHVAYPFLAFLALRQAFGRIGYIALGYTALVAFSVMYTGDHWLIDCIGGIAYAYVAYYVVVHAPASVRRRLARLRNDAVATRGSGGGLRGYVSDLRTSIGWPTLAAGLFLVVAGWNWVQDMEHAGQFQTWRYLLPWGVLFTGLCLVAGSILRGRRPARAPAVAADHEDAGELVTEDA